MLLNSLVKCKFYCDGDAVVLLLRHQTCDVQVAGSSPGWAALCASVTKQFNLVPAKGPGGK